MIKNQYCCFCTKTQYSFIVNFVAIGLGENVCVCVYVCVCVCVCVFVCVFVWKAEEWKGV